MVSSADEAAALRRKIAAVSALKARQQQQSSQSLHQSQAGKGGKADAFKLANGLEIALISNNLGDAKTLITHPATTTHSKLSDAAKAELAISGGTLRVSVGLEDGGDLQNDFEQALAKLG